jgi:isocitrate/isopropylmalate dehydrogenase
MLMGWLGRKHANERATAAAAKMLAAVEHVVGQGRHVTRDLGGTASTQEMGDAIAAAVQ